MSQETVEIDLILEVRVDPTLEALDSLDSLLLFLSFGIELFIAEVG